MSVIDVLTRVDAICKKYDKYDIAHKDSNVSGDDAFARLYTSVESEIESLLQKAETASNEKNRASAVAINAEIRRTKAKLLEEVPKLQRLAVKKAKGLSTEELAVRNDLVLALPDRIQAIHDGSAAAPKPSSGWGTSAYRSEIKFDSVMEEQKRRTLQALERRFAQAKAEVQTQQLKRKKQPIDETERVASNAESPSVDSTLKKPRQSKKPASDRSSRNDYISFLGHTTKKEIDVNEPSYLKISHNVHEKLLPNGIEVSDGKAVVNRVLHELLKHGDAAKKYLQGSKSLKIENTILLDNFVQKTSMSSGQAVQNGSKRSKKHMSLKQHKKAGLFDLPKEFHKFEIFKPMHDKWKSYVAQLLKIVGKDQLARSFLNADLHGAVILVVQCKMIGYVGIHGIMIRETKETFGIITQDNKFRVVPKKGSTFVLQADCWKITLHGDGFASRNLVP